MWKGFLYFLTFISLIPCPNLTAQEKSDLWKTHKMHTPIDIYSQTRLFVKIYKRLSAGVIGTIYYSPENIVSEGVHLSLRWKL